MDILTKFLGNDNMMSILFSVGSSGYYLYNIYSNYLVKDFLLLQEILFYF